MRIFVLLIISFLNLQVIEAQADAGLTGALIGASLGAVVGHANNPTGGAGTGALIGGLGGYILGKSMESGGQVRESRHEGEMRSRAHENRPAAKGKSRVLTRKGIRLRCHEGQDFYDKALHVRNSGKQIYLLEKAAWYCPMDARIHNDLGVAYYLRGDKLDRRRAKDQFNIALYLRPDYRAPKDNLKDVR